MASMKGLNKLLYKVGNKVTSMQRPQCLGGPPPPSPQAGADGKVRWGYSHSG